MCFVTEKHNLIVQMDHSVCKLLCAFSNMILWKFLERKILNLWEFVLGLFEENIQDIYFFECFMNTQKWYYVKASKQNSCSWSFVNRHPGLKQHYCTIRWPVFKWGKLRWGEAWLGEARSGKVRLCYDKLVYCSYILKKAGESH